ncbi:MAG: AmmeMemoRadiSam system radical SAM enzyme [Bacilli bacterium]
MKCNNCFRHCDIKDGFYGFCRGRKNLNNTIISDNYGYCTSLELDPIEKKPFKNFYPGSMILSYGSYGCNLKCPFCQNYEISQYTLKNESKYISPNELVNTALGLIKRGNIGIAFTYNEPLVSYEYVRDTSKLAKEKGLKTVLVTNGCFSDLVIDEVLPYIDAMNIDLKGFTKDFYDFVGGDLEMVKHFIVRANEKCHVELTTLIIPGKNDDEKIFLEEVKWISSINKDMPLHITRYFPRYKMDRGEPTEIASLEKLAKIAKQYLNFVYIGNV